VLRAQAPTSRHEPLATLGDSLVLCHHSLSASGFSGRQLDVGAYEIELFALVEVDSTGRQRRAEYFASDHLGDAIARLYERYAELLPEGSERTRAAATARSVATVMRPVDADRYATAIASGVEYVDRRSLRVLGSASGAEAFLRGARSLREVGDDIALRIDDVLDLDSTAILVRLTTTGTARTGGGAYEKQLLELWVFGIDGLVTRCEEFDTDRDAEALARFAALTAPLPTKRRVRPNAATAAIERLRAAFAARDLRPIARLFADGFEQVEHTTGAAYGREGAFASLHATLRSSNPSLRYEPLATLGESVALLRRSTSSGATSGRSFDVGASEAECLSLVDVDERGQLGRGESFAADRLGDAIARLYERYAEILPEGPERERAAATARSITAGMLHGTHPEALMSPDVEFSDRRRIGLLGSVRGIDAIVRGNRAVTQLADDFARQVHDIIAFLVSRTTSGTHRDGGGAFENHYLMLRAYDADGRARYIEWFDPDAIDAALAHFDELTAALPAKRRVSANAATASAARLDAAVAAGDLDAVRALLAEDMENLHHPTDTHYDREGALFSLRALAGARELHFEHMPLATLGDSLALFRCFSSFEELASDDMAPFGAVEREQLVLFEMDATGRQRVVEFFAADRLGDAVVRLYEQNVELLPDGPERARAAATARSVVTFVGPFDLARFATAIAPTIDYVDHRHIAMETAHGAEAWLRGMGALVELADDITNRVDDILGLRSDVFLLRWVNSGTERVGGGAFERHFLLLGVFGPDGLMAHLEAFEVGREAEALARFDQLTAVSTESRFANAASRAVERYERCWRDGDLDGVVSTFVPSHSMDDRRKLMRWQIAGDDFFANLRMNFAQGVQWQTRLLATRGDRLALFHVLETSDGEAGGVGPAESEFLWLVEVDAEGRRSALVIFDPDDQGAAYTELGDRYAAGEGAGGGASLLS
jgi:hypothetical protein